MAKAKAKICTKRFVLDDGSEVASAAANAEALTFAFEGGETFEVTLDMFSEDIQQAALWHGFSQKLGDSYSSKSGLEAEEAFGALLEQLQAGNWVSERTGGGPRITMVAEAVERALIGRGETVDDDRRARIFEQLRSKPEAPKAALGDERIKAEYEKIKAEKAAERAAAAAEAAEEAGAEAEGALDTF